jgi:hypothetical protein
MILKSSLLLAFVSFISMNYSQSIPETEGANSNSNPFKTENNGNQSNCKNDYSKIKRHVIKYPDSITKIVCVEKGKLVIRVKIDEYGLVVETPVYDKNLTTITDQHVIEQIIQLIKEQAKWTPEPGAKIFTAAITISFSP